MDRSYHPAPLPQRLLRACGIVLVLAAGAGLVPLAPPLPPGLPPELAPFASRLLTGVLIATALIACVMPLPRWALAALLGAVGSVFVLNDTGTIKGPLTPDAVLAACGAGAQALTMLLALFALGLGDPVPQERRGRAPMPKNASHQRRLLGRAAAVEGRVRAPTSPAVTPRRITPKAATARGSSRRPIPVVPQARATAGATTKPKQARPAAHAKPIRVVAERDAHRLPEVLPSHHAPVLLLAREMMLDTPDPLDSAPEASSA